MLKFWINQAGGAAVAAMSSLAGHLRPRLMSGIDGTTGPHVSKGGLAYLGSSCGVVRL